MSSKLAKREAPARPNRPRAQGSATAAAELLAWYDRHARRLPWRVGPRERRLGIRPDPYRVWLSEVMLQQTTVKAVAPYFERFIARWPGIAELAAAEDNEIMAAWAGLGYYSRARNLIACARFIAEHLGGRFPETAVELSQLPGIGGYTSAAIAAIAFDQSVAAIDGNVERVIARLFAIDTPLQSAKPQVATALEQLLPADRPGEFAEALMDLGATICTPKKPACSLCPWSERCVARRDGRQLELPVRAEKKPRPTRVGTAYVTRRSDGAILLRRRPPRGLLGGMSEVPGTDWSETHSEPRQPPLAATWTKLAVPVEHTFTHFSLRLSIERADVALDAPAPSACWWAPASTLPAEALPSVMKKAIEAAYPGANKAETASTMTEIRHLVFDVGRVLVHYDPHQGFYDLIPDEAERNEFLRVVCSNEWNLEQDRGRSWEDAEAEAIGRHPDKHELIRAFRKNWHKMVDREYPESVALYRTLIAKGHDVTLLTNFAKDTFREAQRRFPALAESRGVTVSGEVGFIKPDPAIYEHHTRSFGLTPSATLFIDDSQKNIDAARGHGWNAELFTSVEKLRDDLGRYGIGI